MDNRYFKTWRNDIAHGAINESMGCGPNFIKNPEHNFKPKAHYYDNNFVQVVQPLRMFEPSTLAEIKQGVKEAVRSHLKVKAVGSGHSYSDITTTTDYLMMTDNLNKIKYNKEKKEIDHFKFLKKAVQDDYAQFIKDCEIEERQKETPDFNAALVEKKDISLYELEAGTKIKHLNNALWEDGFSLYNMGTYQGQAFIGAVSTSTHGSGLNLGPLPDMIKSLVIVAENGIVVRIEPEKGITEPGKPLFNGIRSWFPNLDSGFKKKLSDLDRISKEGKISISNETNVDFLVQDNHWFNSVICNVGCFGIIYSVIIEVIPRFYLVETVELTIWSELRQRLQRKDPEIFESKDYYIEDIDKTVSKIRHSEILLNPHKYKGEIFCRITRRYALDYKHGKNLMLRKYHKLDQKSRDFNKSEKPNIYRGIAKGSANGLAEKVKNNTTTAKKLNKFIVFGRVDGKPLPAIHVNPAKIAAKILANSNKSIMYPSDSPKNQSSPFYSNRNYRVYQQPSGINGFGVETAFNMKANEAIDLYDGPYIDAIDTAINLAEQHLLVGGYVQTATTAVRFVKASNAYISPQYGRLTCMVEMLNVADTHGGKELFERYQNNFFEFGGRPHWGLDLSVTTGNNNLMLKMYPMYNHWKKVYDVLNAFGTFNNRFTSRMGFSLQDYLES